MKGREQSMKPLCGNNHGRSRRNRRKVASRQFFPKTLPQCPFLSTVDAEVLEQAKQVSVNIPELRIHVWRDQWPAAECSGSEKQVSIMDFSVGKVQRIAEGPHTNYVSGHRACA